jgi:hypothetical protein
MREQLGSDAHRARCILQVDDPQIVVHRAIGTTWSVPYCTSRTQDRSPLVAMTS